jgi:hypothetical protein
MVNFLIFIGIVLAVLLASAWGIEVLSPKILAGKFKKQPPPCSNCSECHWFNRCYLKYGSNDCLRAMNATATDREPGFCTEDCFFAKGGHCSSTKYEYYSHCEKLFWAQEGQRGYPK